MNEGKWADQAHFRKTLNLFITRYGLTEHGASGCKLSGIISIHTSVSTLRSIGDRG